MYDFHILKFNLTLQQIPMDFFNFSCIFEIVCIFKSFEHNRIVSWDFLTQFMA